MYIYKLEDLHISLFTFCVKEGFEFMRSFSLIGVVF